MDVVSGYPRPYEKDAREGRTFVLRSRTYGERQYVALGAASDGWSRERAERELRHVLADFERGSDESPAGAGPSDNGRGWFRTDDLSRVKRVSEADDEPLVQGTLF